MTEAEAPDDRHFVIGTCGHIDHGKSALVRALTGSDPDRLPEEKKRGITIELGFGLWDLGNGIQASIVDVPGHERFVRTMAAGAGGLDAVMLVVAADDGVMPQTQEHLAICRLLGVRRGVIVITKADLVEPDLVEFATEDARQLTEGTFLDGAPLVVTSALQGEGLEALKDAVLGLAAAAAAERPAGPGLLPVDRVFTRPGFGTVVTGTQLIGELKVGDAVEVVPGPRGQPLKATVRGVQVHAEAVDHSAPGRRVALNLRGVEVDDVSKGDAICAAGTRLAATVLHGDLEVLEGAGAVEENTELSLHVGTADRLARVVPLARETLEEGGRGVVRLVLSAPVAAFAGQRFIVRRPGAHGQGTVGGGEILDTEPSGGRRSFQRWREVAEAIVEAGDDLPARVKALLKDARAEGLDPKALRRRCPPWTDPVASAEQLVAAGQAVFAGNRFIDGALVQETCDALLDVAAAVHDERPFMIGVSGSELSGRLPRARQVLAEAALVTLAEREQLVRAGAGYRLASQPIPERVQAGLAKVLAALAEGATQPPSEAELASLAGLDEGATRDVLSELKRRGDIEPLRDGMHFASSALQAVEERVITWFDQGGQELGTAEFKTLSGGVSRKYAIPLLEHLDQRGVTRRAGDARVRGPQAGS